MGFDTAPIAKEPLKDILIISQMQILSFLLYNPRGLAEIQSCLLWTW